MFGLRLLGLVLLLFCLGCGSASPLVQPQINSLVVAHRPELALKLLEEHKESYGAKNRLLYLLDYGLVLHLTERYKESIGIFEEAKRVFDQLYQRSISNEMTTWAMNDTLAPYRGEEFERVMINIFQALNFVMLGNFEEALVEARDVDLKLGLMNTARKARYKNVYREDAFARLLMGILYEARGTLDDLNDAFISYAKAVEIYEQDYSRNYAISLPQVLKENILAVSQSIRPQDYETYRRKFRDVPFPGLSEKKKRAEVYLIYYAGLSAVKHPVFVPIPLPDGIVTQLAFPTFDQRGPGSQAAVFRAKNLRGEMFEMNSEKLEDITSIAIQNLKSKRTWVIAKATLRAASKYWLEKKQKQRIEEKNDDAAQIFGVVSSFYNIFSEQPDLRSWQTLPAEIHLARVILEPGEYEFFVNEESLEKLTLTQGAKKFFIVRENTLSSLESKK